MVCVAIYSVLVAGIQYKGENSPGKEKEIHNNNTGKDRKGHRYGNKLRDHELVPESEDLNSYKSSISNKQKKVRLMKEEAKAGRHCRAF